MSASRSTTSPIDKPSVTTSTASGALTNGPTARLESRWSRATCWASTSAKDRRLTPLLQVVDATASPLAGTGRQENLALGVREHHGPLIAAFGHDVAGPADGLLEFHQVLANPGIVRRIADMGRDLTGPNRVADVLAVQEDPLIRKADLDSTRQLGPSRGGVACQSPPQRGQGHRPVHRAGVQEAEPQSFRQQFGYRTLAGAGRTVDRDNHCPSAFGCGLQ